LQELTEQQAAFALEYARSGKGAEAARAAGYSRHSAGKYAHQLLAKPHVQAEIQKQQRLAFRSLASVALDQIRALLENPSTPPGVRVEIAKTVWDRCGLAAIRADEVDGPAEERSLRDMSLQELEAMARRLQEAKRVTEAPELPASHVLIGEASSEPGGLPPVDSE
jgi:hypothetical protein